MKNTDDFLGGLQSEFLLMAAHNFFGKRIEAEKRQEALFSDADKLSKQVPALVSAAGLLHGHVVEPHNFYKMLNIEPHDLFSETKYEIDGAYPELCPLRSKKGKYTKLVQILYNNLANAADAYNYGVKSDLLCYKGIEEDIEFLNHRIKMINQNPPSNALQFARSFENDRYKGIFMPGACNYCAMDQRYKLHAIKISEFGLPQIPDLPPLKKVKTEITHFCKDMYKQNKDSILQIMASYAK